MFLEMMGYINNLIFMTENRGPRWNIYELFFVWMKVRFVKWLFLLFCGKYWLPGHVDKVLEGKEAR
jgi:hypothetical protein